MYIQEAIKARVETRKPYITRLAWEFIYPSANPIHAGFKLIPTDTPDGFIIASVMEPELRGGWKPTLSDLMADDWEVTW